MTTTRTLNPPEIVISKNGNQLVKKPNGYYAVYVTNGKRALANLQTTNFALAEQRRDLLFADWLEQGAKYREPKTPQQPPFPRLPVWPPALPTAFTTKAIS